MDDDDRVSDQLDDRLREATEILWTRRQTARAVVEEPTGVPVPEQVVLTDADIAEASGTSLPVVQAWLDTEDGDEVAVERDGDTRIVRALLGE